MKAAAAPIRVGLIIPSSNVTIENYHIRKFHKFKNKR